MIVILLLLPPLNYRGVTTMPSACGAGDQTQGYESKPISYQLSYISNLRLVTKVYYNVQQARSTIILGLGGKAIRAGKPSV